MNPEFDNKDNFSAITTFAKDKKFAQNSSKPVIRNLKLIEPSDTLLKLLVIKDEEAEIRSKYRTIQFWISIGVTCILFAWSYFYVMIPSAEIEINIEEKIHKQTEAHFNDVNIWVINKLNEITKSL